MKSWLESLLSKNKEINIPTNKYMIENWIGELIMKLAINDEKFLELFVIAVNNAWNDSFTFEEKIFLRNG